MGVINKVTPSSIKKGGLLWLMEKQLRLDN